MHAIIETEIGGPLSFTLRVKHDSNTHACTHTRTHTNTHTPPSHLLACLRFSVNTYRYYIYLEFSPTTKDADTGIAAITAKRAH